MLQGLFAMNAMKLYVTLLGAIILHQHTQNHAVPEP